MGMERIDELSRFAKLGPPCLLHYHKEDKETRRGASESNNKEDKKMHDGERCGCTQKIKEVVKEMVRWLQNVINNLVLADQKVYLLIIFVIYLLLSYFYCIIWLSLDHFIISIFIYLFIFAFFTGQGDCCA